VVCYEEDAVWCVYPCECRRRVQVKS
jgi:hypothetical protein